MTFAEWLPRLEVQVPELDAQHRELFDRLNRLWDAHQAEDSTGLVELQAFLLEYAEHHFRSEEALMDAAGYDLAVSHKALHQAFRLRIAEFEQRRARVPQAVTGELLDFLLGWLVQHIAREDKRLGAFLRTRDGGS